MNVKARNKQIREMTTKLEASHPEGFLYITSRGASTVSQVSCANAARHLVEDSHTISTPEEIAAYNRRNAAVREQLQRGEVAQNKPTLGITVTDR